MLHHWGLTTPLHAGNQSKKARQHAAHSMTVSGVSGTDSQLVFILRRMSGEIGNVSRPSKPLGLTSFYSPQDILQAVPG